MSANIMDIYEWIYVLRVSGADPQMFYSYWHHCIGVLTGHCPLHPYNDWSH